MLLGEDLGRRHQRSLVTGLGGMQHGQRGDDGLAAADIALQQPLHRMRAGQVRGDLAPGAALGGGKREGQALEQRPGEVPLASRRGALRRRRAA